MKKPYIYKIHDTDLEEYSQYIITSEECFDIIQNAIGDWYDEDCQHDDCDNIFDCVEKYLEKNNIQFAWFEFNDKNTINF